MATSKQTYKLHEKDKFSSYLKKFSNIEKSLLLEIHDHKLVAKTFTPDKSVVKVSSVLLTDVMDEIPSAQPGPEHVKIGLFAVDHFIQSFKQFPNDNEVKLEINSESVGDDTVATKIEANSKALKIKFPCASPSMFKYISGDLADQITNTDASQFSFRIEKDQLSTISGLTKIDSENDTLMIESDGTHVQFSGKNFDYQVDGVTPSGAGTIAFYKSHFGFIDQENSEIFVLDSKVIVKSLESDTVIVIGKVE